MGNRPPEFPSYGPFITEEAVKEYNIDNLPAHLTHSKENILVYFTTPVSTHWPDCNRNIRLMGTEKLSFQSPLTKDNSHQQ